MPISLAICKVHGGFDATLKNLICDNGIGDRSSGIEEFLPSGRCSPTLAKRGITRHDRCLDLPFDLNPTPNVITFYYGTLVQWHGVLQCEVASTLTDRRRTASTQRWFSTTSLLSQSE